MVKKRSVQKRKIKSTSKRNKGGASKIEKINWYLPPKVKEETFAILYSKRAIYSFSFAFSIIFGAVLMAMNLRSLKKSEGITPVIGIAILYLIIVTAVISFLESYINSKLTISYIFVFLGAWLILDYFWDKYIGDETRYQKRGVFIPSIVGIIIFAIIILLFSYA